MPQGTGFVNFQDILEKNRPQAESQAQQIYQGLNLQGQGLQQQTQQASQDYAQKAKAGLNVAADPTAITATSDTAGHRTYSGPQSTYTSPGTIDLDQQRVQADKFSRNLNSMTTMGGVQGQLQQQNRGKNYTQGQSRMDAALVQNTAGNRFNELRGKYATVYDDVNKAQSDAMSLDNSYRKQAGDAQAKTEATLAAARAGEDKRWSDQQVRNAEQAAKNAEAAAAEEKRRSQPVYGMYKPEGGYYTIGELEDMAAYTETGRAGGGDTYMDGAPTYNPNDPRFHTPEGGVGLENAQNGLLGPDGKPVRWGITTRRNGGLV